MYQRNTKQDKYSGKQIFSASREEKETEEKKLQEASLHDDNIFNIKYLRMLEGDSSAVQPMLISIDYAVTIIIWFIRISRPIRK